MSLARLMSIAILRPLAGLTKVYVGVIQTACKKFRQGGKTLSPGGKKFTGAADGFLLDFISGQEFEAVAQAIPVAYQRPQFQGNSAGRERELQGGDLAHIQLASQGNPNSVLAELDGPPPKLDGRIRPEDFGPDTDVEWIPRISPGRCRASLTGGHRGLSCRIRSVVSMIAHH